MTKKQARALNRRTLRLISEAMSSALDAAYKLTKDESDPAFDVVRALDEAHHAICQYHQNKYHEQLMDPTLEEHPPHSKKRVDISKIENGGIF